MTTMAEHYGIHNRQITSRVALVPAPLHRLGLAAVVRLGASTGDDRARLDPQAAGEFRAVARDRRSVQGAIVGTLYDHQPLRPRHVPEDRHAVDPDHRLGAPVAVKVT